MFNNILVAALLATVATAVLAQDQSSCIKSAAGHALADCAFGYGADTTGGQGGASYVVTSAADDGSAGTIRAILASLKGVTGGKWITFAQGQTFNIALTDVLDIKSDAGAEDLTIDGRGATVTFTNYGLNVFKTNNVIIHGITIKNVVKKQDLLQISEATNVWIDHVTFSNEAWGVYPSEGDYPDGACDITNGSAGVTISFCDLNHHNKTMLIGNSDSKSSDTSMRVTVAFNHFGNALGQRLPRMRYGKFDVANNWYESRELMIGGSSDPAALIRNNVFDTGSTHNIFYQPADDAIVSFFISGNLLLNGATDNYASILHGSQSSFTTGYAWTPVAASSVQAIVSANAGAGKSGSSSGSAATTTTTKTVTSTVVASSTKTTTTSTKTTSTKTTTTTKTTKTTTTAKATTTN